MQIEVDQIKCKTAGICVKLCPEVFRFEVGSKKAAAIESKIPAHLADKCLEAQRQYPQEAINLLYTEVTNE